MVQSTPDSSTPGQASLTVPVRRHSDAPRPAPAAYGPEDDPLMRSVSRMVQARGHAEGHKEGHADGRVRGRIEAVTATLHARGIEVSGDLAQDHGLFAEHPIEPLMAAALACTGEADFRRRLREETG